MLEGVGYRTKFIDPDYRRAPKTLYYCVRCQRDIKPDSPVRWVAFELDHPETAIHPDDLVLALSIIRPTRAAHHHDNCILFEPLGSECLRKVGREWTFTQPVPLQRDFKDMDEVELSTVLKGV